MQRRRRLDISLTLNMSKISIVIGARFNLIASCYFTIC